MQPFAPEDLMMQGHIALAPATLISVPTHLIYRHFGIVTEFGTVISNSARAGGVREESIVEFSGGKTWRIERRPSDMAWWNVVRRARSAQPRPYNLLSWNCETFVSFAYGLPPQSSQVEVSLLVALTGLLAVSAARA